MASKLKFWNGDGSFMRNNNLPFWRSIRKKANIHASVAAPNRKEARRLITAFCGRDPGNDRMRDMWFEWWGDDMKNVTPEQGLWIDYGKGPIKVV